MLHLTAASVLGSHSVVLSIPKFWLMSSLQPACIFTNNLSWFLFRESGPSTGCQASASPHDSNSVAAATTEAAPPSMALPGSSLSCSPWLLYAFKTSATWEAFRHYQVWLSVNAHTALTPSGPQLLCAVPKETLARNFWLNDAPFLLITMVSSIPAD